MAVSGTESYTTAYTYDANNRLTTEAKTQSGTTTTTTYTYDDNGNLLTELDATNTAVVTHAYDNFNRLTSTVVGTTTITYSYNAQGIRTGRQVGDTYTQYLLDGGNVTGEVVDGTLSTAYIRGANLILRRSGTSSSYYLYNAHGDVVQLTDATGTVTKSYDYDAFGNEENPSATDANPFRYCGEYYDTETGLYYLRARYYDPTVGRFTQEDTHWNTANMIYGDNPQKINEREDALGLKTYSYVPQISAVMQSGNLYVYGLGNPVLFVDPTGNLAWPGEIHNAVVEHLSTVFGLFSEQRIEYGSPVMLRDREYRFGRADLVSFDGQVWEVKPDNWWGVLLGKQQLMNYVSGKWVTKENAVVENLRYGGPIPDGGFPYTGASGSYYVSYRYYENGLILYKFEPRKTATFAPVEVTVVSVAAGGAFIACIVLGDGVEKRLPALA